MLLDFCKERVISAVASLYMFIQSNLLQGIIKGSPDVPTSVSFIEELFKLGINKCYCSYRMYSNFYPNMISVYNNVKCKPDTVLKNEQIYVAATDKGYLICEDIYTDYNSFFFSEIYADLIWMVNCQSKNILMCLNRKFFNNFY